MEGEQILAQSQLSLRESLLERIKIASRVAAISGHRLQPMLDKTKSAFLSYMQSPLSSSAGAERQMQQHAEYLQLHLAALSRTFLADPSC